MSYHALGEDMTASRGGPSAEYGTGVNYAIPPSGGPAPAPSDDTSESTDQASTPARGGGSAPYYAGGTQAPGTASAGLSTMTLAVMAGLGLAGYWLYTRLG